MPDSRVLAILGAGLLLFGTLMPVVSVPILGSMTYFQYNSNDALVVVLLAVGTFILAATRRTSLVLWTGLGALAMLAYSYISLQSAMAEMRDRLEAELSGTLFGGLAEAALGSVQMRWGWAILVLGAALVIWAGWRARPRRGDRREPARDPGAQ